MVINKKTIYFLNIIKAASPLHHLGNKISLLSCVVVEDRLCIVKRMEDSKLVNRLMQSGLHSDGLRGRPHLE